MKHIIPKEDPTNKLFAEELIEFGPVSVPFLNILQSFLVCITIDDFQSHFFLV